MEGNVETLVEEIAKLRHENAQLARARDELTHTREELEHERSELAKRVDLLGEQIAWYKHRFLARHSESLSAEEKRQMRLFDEAEQAMEQISKAGAQEPIRVGEHIRARPKRRPLPEDLPREEVVLDIPEQDKHCACGAELKRIGEETSEKLDVIPPRLKVIRTVRPKYACHRCEGSGDEEKPAVRIAAMPAALIDKGIASAGLLAYVVTAKFCDCLPLYRQEKQFARIGVELSRSTMADWMIAVSQACAPLMVLLQQRLYMGPLLQVDETTVQVMEEPDRANTSKSYMWVARGGTVGATVIFYHYAPSRGAQVAKELIGDYRGHLQTDGYEAYDRVCELRQGLIHAGCWAHARRKFFEARKSSQKAGSAEIALSLIAKLYRLEGLRAELTDDEAFAAARRVQARPILEELHAWLQRRAEQVPPASLLGKAVGYTLVQWPKLLRYLDLAVMTPDTNACENAIRPFVLGRKNWLFSGSPRGAQASATLFSLIETAKANGKDPYWYLRELFDGLPVAKTDAQVLKLAPFRADTS